MAASTPISLSRNTPTTRYTATIFSKSRPANTLETSALSPETITSLTSSIHATHPILSSNFTHLDNAKQISEVEITSSVPVFPSQLRQLPPISQWEQDHNVEVVLQATNVFRRHKRLAVFDMDSTLIQQEVIDEIARKLGVEAQVSAITERAMNGELDFTASLRERCALLKGVPSTVFEELRSVITLTPGAKELVRALKKLGYKTAVLSGGFTPLTSWQAQQLGLDYAFANHLAVSEDGATLTGEVIGEIVNAEKKREHLINIAAKEGILLEQVMAVGDGANDLLMMSVAGLGVAFNAKPKVQREAPARVNSKSLSDVLYLLGFTEDEQKDLIAEENP